MTGQIEPARRAAIFDLDGVLVDSFEVMRAAFTAAYRQVVGDGPAPFEEYRRHLGLFLPDIMRIMGLPVEVADVFIAESTRLTPLATVYDGVPEMLDELRAAGVRLAVATGKHGWRARHLLGTVGLGDRFDCIVGSDEVARPKPAPDIARACLSRLRADAAHAIFVGDAPADIRSARAASVTAAAALWGGEADSPRALLAERPDLLLHRPADTVTACLSGALS